jgi:hypothetical protein
MYADTCLVVTVIGVSTNMRPLVNDQNRFPEFRQLLGAHNTREAGAND